MILTLHLPMASLLLISHGYFLFRSIFLLKNHKTPDRLDRLSLNLSQILLPLVIITGFITAALSETFPPIHGIIGFFPLVLMFVLRKKSFRKKHPLVLPALNGILLATAFVTGILFK